MKSIYITISIFLLLSLAIVNAEDKLPREYTRPEELISLNSETPLNLAFSILSQMAQKFINKVIVDPGEHSDPIGININNMHWRDALELICKLHNLWYKETQQYIEIIDLSEKNKSGEQSSENIKPDCREIKIESVFFEVERQFLKELGIDWSAVKDGKITISLNGHSGSSVSESAFDTSINGDFKAGKYTVSINFLLKMIESLNKGEIIANPKITVMNGKKGRIQVGKDFSIKTRDFAGNVIDNFFSTGTILEVTPTVYKYSDIEFIHLYIHVERSSATPDVISTVVNKVEANSSVLLLSGETTVIGGLYSTEKIKVRKGVPFLKDLPWYVLGLRYLFGYNRYEIKHKELIILIRAELLPDLKSRSKEKFAPTIFQKLDDEKSEVEKRLIKLIKKDKRFKKLLKD